MVMVGCPNTPRVIGLTSLLGRISLRTVVAVAPPSASGDESGPRCQYFTVDLDEGDVYRQGKLLGTE